MTRVFIDFDYKKHDDKIKEVIDTPSFMTITWKKRNFFGRHVII